MAAQNRPSRSGLKVRWLMVSGFLTSPYDHERISSGEDRAILMASKSSGWRCWLKRLRRSFMALTPGIENGDLGMVKSRASDSWGSSQRAVAFDDSPFPAPYSRLTSLPDRY